MVPVVEQLYEDWPKLFVQPEKELRRNCEVEEIDERLRLAFWDEYNMATGLNRGMSLENVMRGICSIEFWKSHYERDKKKLIWIITPPVSYARSMQFILHKGLDRLQEIMELPIRNKQGNVDLRAVTQIIKVFQLVDLRLKGSVLHRVQVQQQNLNYNADISKNEMDQLAGMSLDQLEDLDQKLARLEKTEEKMVNALPPAEKAEVIEAKQMMFAPRDSIDRIRVPDIDQENETTLQVFNGDPDAD